MDVPLVTYIPREEYFGAPPDSANLVRDFVNFHVLVLGSTIAHNQRELPRTNRCNPVNVRVSLGNRKIYAKVHYEIGLGNTF